MRGPETRTAAPSAKGSGSETETIGVGFEAENYRSACLRSIPSPECSDRLAIVVRRGDRLFAMGTYREGAR